VIVDVLLNPLGVDPTEFVGLVVFVEMLADLGFVREGSLTQYGQSGIDYAFEESGEKSGTTDRSWPLLGSFLVDDRGCLGRSDRLTFLEKILNLVSTVHLLDDAVVV